MYDHRDPAMLVEFVSNVPLFNYADIMDTFEERGIVELNNERFSTAEMSKADRKLLVRSLKDGGFKFNVLEFEDDTDTTKDRIIDICLTPGFDGFTPIEHSTTEVEPTEEPVRIGMMSAMEYNQYLVNESRKRM